MADTKRLLLLKALCEYLLAEITTDNGYNYTLAAAYRNRNRFGEDMALPAVAILENFNPDRIPENIGGTKDPKHKYVQIYLVNGWVDDDATGDEPGDGAHRLLGDFKTAMGKLITQDAERDGYFNKLGIGLRIEPGVVRPADENSSKAFFWLRISFEIVEKVKDPYWITD